MSRFIIIFGCGKNGKTVYEYLKKTNKKQRVLCFADNNADYKTKYRGKRIIRPELAKKLYKNALWIITSPDNSVQMVRQLQEMQINMTDILLLTAGNVRDMYKSIHKYWYDEDKYFMYDYGFPVNVEFLINQVKTFLYTAYCEQMIKKECSVGRKDRKYKYNVSICAIFLNEAPYMQEWIEFHKIVGIEHFYLYNNMSTDEYKRVLDPYIKEKIVTLIDWEVPHGQISAYCNCVERFSDEARWIGFIDFDEFVVPRKKKIYDYLKQYNYRCGAVLIYWKTFGSSGKSDRRLEQLVTEDFKKCWPKYEDIGKCFYNSEFLLASQEKNGESLQHICWTKRNGKDLPPINVYGKVSLPDRRQRAKKSPAPIQINHYATKSYKEYQKKITQPDAVYENNPRTDATFHYYDGKATALDCVIDQYLPELKNNLKMHKNA